MTSASLRLNTCVTQHSRIAQRGWGGHLHVVIGSTYQRWRSAGHKQCHVLSSLFTCERLQGVFDARRDGIWRPPVNANTEAAPRSKRDGEQKTAIQTNDVIYELIIFSFFSFFFWLIWSNPTLRGLTAAFRANEAQASPRSLPFLSHFVSISHLFVFLNSQLVSLYLPQSHFETHAGVWPSFLRLGFFVPAAIRWQTQTPRWILKYPTCSSNILLFQFLLLKKTVSQCFVVLVLFFFSRISPVILGTPVWATHKCRPGAHELPLCSRLQAEMREKTRLVQRERDTNASKDNKKTLFLKHVKPSKCRMLKTRMFSRGLMVSFVWNLRHTTDSHNNFTVELLASKLHVEH